MFLFVLILVAFAIDHSRHVADHFEFESEIYVEVNDSDDFQNVYIDLCKTKKLKNCYEFIKTVVVRFRDQEKEFNLTELGEMMIKLATMKDENIEAFKALVDDCYSPGWTTTAKNAIYGEDEICFLANRVISGFNYAFNRLSITSLEIGLKFVK